MSKSTMKAVGVYRSLPLDDEDALVDLKIDRPKAGPQDLLVEVDAISVNPADYRSRTAKLDDGTFAILGWDVAGTVVECGSAVPEGFNAGDYVFYAGDNMRQGANAEFHVVDHRIVGHQPRGISPAVAAAVPLVALTAWEALFDRLRLQILGSNRYRSLLIIGGAGGVGSLAIQLACQIPDLTVIATASRPDSSDWCRAMGADFVIDHSEPLEPQLAATGLNSVDAVLLLHSPDIHFPALSRIISPQGAICCIVPFAAHPDLNQLMRKSISFHWELMFTRPAFQTSDMHRQSAILNSVAKMLGDGRLISPLKTELSPFCARTLIEAHKKLESQRTIGKIVITGFGSTSAV